MATIRFNGLENIIRRAGVASDKAAHTVALQVKKDTKDFTPASGEPSGLYARTTVEGHRIIYPGPYANFLYRGKLMVDPDTGSPWAQVGATKVLTGKDLDIKKAVHDQAQSHWFEASKAQNLDKWIRVARKAAKHEF